MWDTRYRPLVFSDVLGQEGSVRVLRSRLAKGEAFDTSYIFAGGHGSGKTTLARILARAMLCQNRREDGDPCNACDHCQACLSETMAAFTELDAASQGTTADMRRIVDHLVYDTPGVAKRIYLLDEAHRMSRDAQDVLLKPIEDKRVVVLFCTTEYGKIRDTIKSRCETYEIRKIQKEDILGRVQHILTQEGVAFEDDAVLTVIDYARGHVRDVLNKLETIAQLGPLTMDAVRERLDLAVVSLYYDILLALGDAPEVIRRVEDACDRVGPVQVATGLAEAAMNAYRYANKIFTDHSQLDSERAARVHERFGEATVHLARYFLSLGAYVSRLDLVCAALACGKSGPALVAPQVTTVPVMVVASVAPPALAPVPTMRDEPPAVVPTSSPASAPTAPTPVSPAPVSDEGTAATSSAVASMGYTDGNIPMYPEDAEAMLMPAERPKGIGHSNPPVLSAKAESTRSAPKSERLGFGREEFTATFHEFLGSFWTW